MSLSIEGYTQSLKIRLEYANDALTIRQRTYQRLADSDAPESLLEDYKLKVMEAEEKVKLLELELKERIR
jgi:hypothetical protein